MCAQHPQANPVSNSLLCLQVILLVVAAVCLNMLLLLPLLHSHDKLHLMQQQQQQLPQDHISQVGGDFFQSFDADQDGVLDLYEFRQLIGVSELDSQRK